MKALQIGFVLVVGTVYVMWSSARPDLTWPLRLGTFALITIFFIVTNVVRGRPALAANNPLEADEMPSLNLTSAGRDDAPNEARPPESASRSETAKD